MLLWAEDKKNRNSYFQFWRIYVRVFISYNEVVSALEF